MIKKIYCIALFLFSISLFSCSSLQQSIYHIGEPTAQCLPSFPDKDGWYGGDGAYSILLDDKRTLWLFGDSFVSEEKGRQNRVGMDVVLGTTLAISTCSEKGKFNIQYFIKKEDGKFVSFFGDTEEWLWPHDPFIFDGTLFIPMLIVKALAKDHAPFNFAIIGHKIAVIKNFEKDNPQVWQIDYLDITKSIPPEITALATTSIVYQNYVYFYPLCKFSNGTAVFSGNALARVSADKLNQENWEIEYYNQDGNWSKKLDARQAKIMFTDALSELSVRYRPNKNKWIAVYASTKDKGDKLLYQEAPRLEGPWTEQKVLAGKIPEVDKQSPLYDKNTFCYAGKEHIQFSREKNIVATYVCNSLEEDTKTSFIRRNLFLYRPVVVNISY